ncbi:MAG: TatD family hydrolase, partial [Gemmatimonadota bacterium]
HEATRFGASARREIDELAGDPTVVALGETGLDYHYDHAPRDAQRASFRAHLELGSVSGLPVVVHSREADEDTASAIREWGGAATGVLHCFSAGPAVLDAGLEAGWYVSFSGLATFVPELGAAVRAVPDDRILIETDSPYLAPVPKRGRRNEPAFLRHTCDAVASLRRTDPAELARLTRRNARRLYRLDVGGRDT